MNPSFTRLPPTILPTDQKRGTQKYGRLDVLIYNSGAIFWASVQDTPFKRFQLMQRVNPEGLYAVIQASLKHLKQSNGRIVVVSPPIYSRFFRGKTAYAMGKVGMSVLTKGLAMDFVRQGLDDMAITSIWPAVVCICPPFHSLQPTHEGEKLAGVKRTNTNQQIRPSSRAQQTKSQRQTQMKKKTSAKPPSSPTPSRPSSKRPPRTSTASSCSTRTFCAITAASPTFQSTMSFPAPHPAASCPPSCPI